MKVMPGWIAIAALWQGVARAQEAPPPETPVEEPAFETPVEEPAGEAERPSTPTMDHLELDPTSITGNRELPKVMVIVPWKRGDIGELQGKPANSLLNEVLSPVDRDVFRRELRYFDALEGDRIPSSGPADAANAAPPAKPET
jgi:hypothetical protein